MLNSVRKLFSILPLCNSQTFLLAGILVVALPGEFLQAEDHPEQAEFFEKSVRPLLVSHCQDCHGEDLSESGFRVDSLGGLLKGGERGPSIVPGKPDESLLILAIRHSERLKMPPEEKMPIADIQLLEKWIQQGAYWPNAKPIPMETTEPNVVQFTEEQKSFWAFQTPVKPSLPNVKHSDWVQSPIDAFILAKLESEGMTPAAPANKRTLIRRATYALTGLPPTPEEVADFLADDSPTAFEKVVDRLLASPRYGEQWGRHWLDVARFADSNGLDENLAYANAWRYRDYVISSLNQDKPFDRFAQEQLAGDLLPDEGQGTRFDQITATGFLTIGPKMLAEDDPMKLRMDIIDEQIDTTGKVFLGMTLGCARCHDHKFDPIPTADYYALAGIFDSTQTMDTFTVVAQWHERELATPVALANREEHQQRIAQAKQHREQFIQHAIRELQAPALEHFGDYLLAAETLQRQEAFLKSAVPLGEQSSLLEREDLILLEAEKYNRGNVLRDTSNYGKDTGVLVNQGQLPNFVEYDITVPRAGSYRLEVRYAAESSRPTRLIINGKPATNHLAAGVTGGWYPESQKWEIVGIFPLQQGQNLIRLEQPQFFPHIDKLLIFPETESVSQSLAALDPDFEPQRVWVDQLIQHLDQLPENSPLGRWNQACDELANQPAKLREFASQLQQTIQKDEQFRDLLTGSDGPLGGSPALISVFPTETQQKLQQAEQEIAQLEKTMPAFPSVMAVEEDHAKNTRLHYRGDHLTLGPEIPRGFPRIMSKDEAFPIPTDESGRLQLALWLTDPHHPLTARVFVNRVWHWHFGNGIVRSPDNFGRLGQRPTHPELLDWLAVSFVESGWSIKKLHREILLSSTWQMSSESEPSYAERDPDNEFYWRRNLHRLTAEQVRDGVLFVCGSLEQTMGGSLLPTENRKYVTSTANVNPVIYSSHHRSVYLPVIRSALFEMFQAFDFADPAVSSGVRQSSTVPSQALFMMNSQLVSEQSTELARWILQDPSVTPETGIQRLYQQVLTRDPTEEEVTRAVRFLTQYEGYWQRESPEGSHQAKEKSWQSLCRALLASNEFLYLD